MVLQTRFWRSSLVIVALGAGAAALVLPSPAADTATVMAAAAPAAAPVNKAVATTAPAKVDAASTLAFLAQHEPEVHKWALVLQQRDPKKFDAVMKEFIPEVRRLLELQSRSPELFAVNMEDRRLAFRGFQLAKELREPNVPTETQTAKRAELAQVVTKQFEVRQKLRQMELDEQAKRVAVLQRQVETLKQDLDKRERNKQTLIEQRIDELVKKTAKSEW